MMTIRIMSVVFPLVVFVGALQAQVTKPVISIESIDSKLKTHWESNKWSDVSVGMMKAVWDGFKTANENPVVFQEAGRIASLGTPNPEGQETYIGQFGPKNTPQRGLLEVMRADGKFWVKLQGQTIPAVMWNKSILFMSGDVVTSSMPAFGGKPHGALEMLAISSINGKFYFVSITGAEPALELVKE
jgi:hypothetical protein